MPSLTIELSESALAEMAEVAIRESITVEAVVARVVEDEVCKREKVKRAAAYVLEKNDELFRRLAK